MQILDLNDSFIGIPSDAIISTEHLPKEGKNKFPLEKFESKNYVGETDLKKFENIVKLNIINDDVFPEREIEFDSDGKFNSVVLFNGKFENKEILFLGLKTALEILYGQSKKLDDESAQTYTWETTRTQLFLSKKGNSAAIMYELKK